MYQFYYAAGEARPRPQWKQNIADRFCVTAIRPAMWEEHCLECSAPLCFESCVHYAPRSDGRCKRFADGIAVYDEPRGCCGQGAHVRFRKWANMMTVVFPTILGAEDYAAMTRKNGRLGKALKALESSRLPRALRWQGIRTAEYLRRRSLRKKAAGQGTPDAFVFHGWSYENTPFRLILEIYDSHTPVFRTALELAPGENLHILSREALSPACGQAGYLVKIYPENDLEATLDILWCDFVQGHPLVQETPAPTVKCMVWDLDNTLWDGTLIETEDPDTLGLKPGILETVRALDEKGVLQSIASKNEFDAAWPVVEKLGLGDYFLYPQIHWNAKSGSIRAIAQALNIGVDSLALMDDSAFEREQVRSALPQVRVYDPAELSGLPALPEFRMPVTEESKNRRAMYRAEQQRQAAQQSDNADTVAFLEKCHLQLTRFTPRTEAQLERCYELIARTNQLNMSGKKYSPEEFAAILETPGHKNVAFACADAFGSYGTVGFAQYRVEGGILHFTEFAMSCRAAGKYVESAFFAQLLKAEGCAEGRFPVVKTKKNSLLRSTLADIGFQAVEDGPEGISFAFDSNLKHSGLVRCNEE